MILECKYKDQFYFTIDTKENTITWGEAKGQLMQFYHGITGKILTIAGTKNYCEAFKSYSFITPHISKGNITYCSNKDELDRLFREATI